LTQFVGLSDLPTSKPACWQHPGQTADELRGGQAALARAQNHLTHQVTQEGLSACG